jgi:hypothetical protein
MQCVFSSFLLLQQQAPLENNCLLEGYFAKLPLETVGPILQ